MIRLLMNTFIMTVAVLESIHTSNEGVIGN